MNKSKPTSSFPPLSPQKAAGILRDANLGGVLRRAADMGIRALVGMDAEKDGQLVVPPPNDPLTLEQLREMDGEPVWVERPGYGSRWALVQVWAKSTNIIYLTCNNGTAMHLQPELESGAKVYRRKPEALGGEAALDLSHPEDGQREGTI